MTDWLAIIREHGPLVWRTAHRILNHEAEAADCFQRTFVSAVEVEATQPIRNWPAILTRLATTRALEQLRVRYRQEGRNVPLTEDPVGGENEAFERASAGELADRLRVALAGINPRQANVFCLVCLEGRSNLEAAAELGITAAHAGVLLQRARAALRERLQVFDPIHEGRP
jgi:RNA polymerase sigma-70 factor (ECF subfamily)